MATSDIDVTRAHRVNAARMNGTRRVARAVVSALIDAGCTVTIFNGGDEPEVKTDSKTEAYKHLLLSDEDRIDAHRSGKCVGFVFLVYGNASWETVCDHTDNKEVHDILKPVFELTAKLEMNSLG